MKKPYIIPKASFVPMETNENIAASTSLETGALRYIHQSDGNGRSTCNAYLANYNIPSYITGGAVGFNDLMESLFKIHEHIGAEAFGDLMEDVRDGSFGCFG